MVSRTLKRSPTPLPAKSFCVRPPRIVARSASGIGGPSLPRKGAHVVGMIAAKQHVRGTESRHQELERRPAVQDGIKIEAADRGRRRLLEIDLRLGRTCQPCCQRPAW